MRPTAGVALAGLALLLGAETFAIAPLLVPGTALLLLGAACPAVAWLGLKGARLERRLPAHRVIEGAELELELELRAGAAGLPAGSVSDPLAPEPAATPALGPRRAVTLRVPARAPRRGRHLLPPPALTVGDPLGLASLSHSAGPGEEVLALPRTEAVRWHGRARLLIGEGTWALLAGKAHAAVDVDGLRPYRESASASRIHWPALARGQGLLERRLRPEADRSPSVALDLRGSAPAESVDALARAAASLALALARAGGCRVLLPGARHPLVVWPDLSGWTVVHARLALVQAGQGGPPPGAGRGPLFLLALQPSLTHPAGVLLLPDPVAAPAGHRLVLEVCGCRGYAPARAHREPVPAAGAHR